MAFLLASCSDQNTPACLQKMGSIVEIEVMVDPFTSIDVFDKGIYAIQIQLIFTMPDLIIENIFLKPAMQLSPLCFYPGTAVRR